MAELAADNKLVVIPAFETETKDWAHLAANGEKEVKSLQAEQAPLLRYGIACYAGFNELEQYTHFLCLAYAAENAARQKAWSKLASILDTSYLLGFQASHIN